MDFPLVLPENGNSNNKMRPNLSEKNGKQAFRIDRVFEQPVGLKKCLQKAENPSETKDRKGKRMDFPLILPENGNSNNKMRPDLSEKNGKQAFRIDRAFEQPVGLEKCLQKAENPSETKDRKGKRMDFPLVLPENRNYNEKMRPDPSEKKEKPPFRMEYTFNNG